jgi:hypothetical protein
MNILSYEARAGFQDIRFPKIDFSKINLIVGDSAA